MEDLDWSSCFAWFRTEIQTWFSHVASECLSHWAIGYPWVRLHLCVHRLFESEISNYTWRARSWWEEVNGPRSKNVWEEIQLLFFKGLWPGFLWSRWGKTPLSTSHLGMSWEKATSINSASFLTEGEISEGKSSSPSILKANSEKGWSSWVRIWKRPYSWSAQYPPPKRKGWGLLLKKDRRIWLIEPSSREKGWKDYCSRREWGAK